MRILAAKTERLIISALCVLATGLPCLAQDPAAQNSVPQPNPVAANSPIPAATGSGGSAAGTQTVPNGASGAPTNAAGPALDYLFNRKPQDGSLAKQVSQAGARADDKAKAAEALGLDTMQDPQVSARFDQYLGMAEVSDADLKAYSAEVDKILGLLKKNQLFPAWKELHVLAGYEKIDAGVSQELANRIEAIWNTGKASNTIEDSNRQLRTDIRTANRNADVMADSIRREDELHQTHNRGGGTRNRNNGGVPQADSPGGDGGTPSMAGLQGKLQLTEEYLSSLEAKAKIKVNELKIQKLFDSAKADFADYIGTLFGSHRHLHTILAANFYRELFDESEYPVAVANQVNASLEISRDVQNSIEVFRYKLGRNELAEATQRLQEAFIASEFNPAVLGVPRAMKQRVADFTTNLRRMQSLIEAHDFGTLETLLSQTKALAVDFDSAKPLALVNAVKLESRLRLGKAKLAAQQGDLKLAMEEFQAAAEAWPANPALNESAGTFFDTQDTKNKSVAEFDRLLAEQNFRAIFEQQLAFAPAIHGDAKREEALKDVLEKIKTAEIAYEKATLMRNAGDVFGAWETIELASTDLPNDNKLNALRADLAGKGAEFVAAINKAKEAEAKQEYGFSLSWYAVAQRYYPNSIIANAAIQRLTQQIFNKG